MQVTLARLHAPRKLGAATRDARNDCTSPRVSIARLGTARRAPRCRARQHALIGRRSRDVGRGFTVIQRVEHLYFAIVGILIDLLVWALLEER
jgi:hypothetical protein